MGTMKYQFMLRSSSNPSYTKQGLFAFVVTNTVFNLLNGSVTEARQGINAIQLEPVAIDNSVQCNRLFFKGGTSYKDTIFVMPRVQPGGGPDGGRTYSISPSTEKDRYNLVLKLYFPKSDEAVRTHAASSVVQDPYACNWDDVIQNLNSKITDPGQKITTIAPSPLTSIEVSIPGIAGTGVIGSAIENTEDAEDLDILDYYDRSLSFYIPLTLAERDYLNYNLVTQDGIAARVRFRFQAKARNAAVYASVKKESLLANLEAKLAGKDKIKIGHLSGFVKSSLNQSAIEITSEFGDSKQSEKIVEKVIDKVLENLNSELAALSVKKSETSKDESNGKGKQTSGAESELPVSMVLDLIASKMNLEFTFNLFSQPQAATAGTEIRLKASKLNDPDVKEVYIQAAYQDPSTGLAINKDQTITIQPALDFVDKILYEDQRKTYLTTKKLKELGAMEVFPNLLDRRMTVEDENTNGNIFAVGRWRLLGSMNPFIYRWTRVQRFPKRVRLKTKKIERNIEEIKNLPVAITFSAIGERTFIPMKELFSENPYFEASYQSRTNQISIRAKQDLGQIQFRETMERGTDVVYGSNALILDEVQEEVVGPMGGRSVEALYELSKDDDPIIEQRGFVFIVRRPSKIEKGQSPTVEYQVKDLQESVVRP